MERSLQVLRVAALAQSESGNAGQDRQKAEVDGTAAADHRLKRRWQRCPSQPALFPRSEWLPAPSCSSTHSRSVRQPRLSQCWYRLWCWSVSDQSVASPAGPCSPECRTPCRITGAATARSRCAHKADARWKCSAGSYRVGCIVPDRMRHERNGECRVGNCTNQSVRHFDPHIRSLVGHQARGRLDAGIDLREAAARKLIAVVDLRRHQISLRSGLAGAGLSIVRRVEIVSELVGGNQR